MPSTVIVSSLKLMAMPGLAFVIGSAVGLAPVPLTVAVLVAACPTGVNAYIIATQFKTGEALASNIVAISTSAAVITVAIWLALLQPF